MDLTEAAHAQIPIDWLTIPHATTQRQSDAVCDAAAWWADRVYPLTHAGPTSAQVMLAWHNPLGGCPGCPACTPTPTTRATTTRPTTSTTASPGS